jgi:hypothetical protein
MTETTGQDVLRDLNAKLQEIGADSIEVGPTKDFTVLRVFDNQESSFITVDTAINWLTSLSNCTGFEQAWQALVNLRNWKTEEPQ